MRRLFTTEEARASGLTYEKLRWGERTGRWRRVQRGVYAEGPAPPSPLDRALAAVLSTRGTASGSLAGVLLGLDGVVLRGADVTVGPERSGRRAGVRRRDLAVERITVIDGIPCTGGLQKMVDLAADLDDIRWEQALESALRKGVVALDDLALTRSSRGAARIRRVLSLRPPGAAPTESLLETLMVQLARTIPGLPPPVRQLEIYDEHGRFVARVDLAWPGWGCSSSSTGSTTRAGRCTTPAARPPSWRPPVGFAGGSRGPRWCGSRNRRAVASLPSCSSAAAVRAPDRFHMRRQRESSGCLVDGDGAASVPFGSDRRDER